MDMNKATAAKPTGFQRTTESQAFSEPAQKGAAQTYERMSAATADAADLVKASCSIARGDVRYLGSARRFWVDTVEKGLALIGEQ